MDKPREWQGSNDKITWVDCGPEIPHQYQYCRMKLPAPGYGPTEAPACPTWCGTDRDGCGVVRYYTRECTIERHCTHPAPQQASAARLMTGNITHGLQGTIVDARDAEIARLRADVERMEAQLHRYHMASARPGEHRPPSKPAPEPYRGIDEWDLLPDV